MNTQETLDLVKAAQGNGQPGDPLNKAITQGTGLVWYDLRAPALSLIPVLTPIRNRIPRVAGEGGTAVRWKAITGINTGNKGPYVSERNRGATIATTVADYLAAYVGIGLEDYVTFEADYAGKNFQDVKALAGLNLLRSMMIQEERLLLGGNNSMALGTTPTPVVTDLGLGKGTLVHGSTLSVICVALTYEGWRLASVGAVGVQASVAKVNADGTTDTYNGGAAQQSAAGTVTLGAGADTYGAAATVAAVQGAVAYAWFAGAAAAEKIVAITTINSVKITDLPAGGNQAASALAAGDKSQNAMAFDGLLTFALKSGVTGYFAAQATGTAGVGTPLTSDAAGGITEIETAFRSFWDTYRLGPDRILVSSQEIANITKKVIGNNGAPLLRLQQAAGQPAMVAGGNVVEGILNKYTNRMVPFEIHPDMIPGTLMFEADTVPYPLSNVANVKEVVCRQDYYQLEWPLTKRSYDYGVYADEVLRVKVPFTLGAISNIANG